MKTSSPILAYRKDPPAYDEDLFVDREEVKPCTRNYGEI